MIHLQVWRYYFLPIVIGCDLLWQLRDVIFQELLFFWTARAWYFKSELSERQTFPHFPFTDNILPSMYGLLLLIHFFIAATP